MFIEGENGLNTDKAEGIARSYLSASFFYKSLHSNNRNDRLIIKLYPCPSNLLSSPLFLFLAHFNCVPSSALLGSMDDPTSVHKLCEIRKPKSPDHKHGEGQIYDSLLNHNISSKNFRLFFFPPLLRSTKTHTIVGCLHG